MTRETQTTIPDEVGMIVRGFLASIQAGNQCAVTGRACRLPEKCGCWIEMANWIKEPLP